MYFLPGADRLKKLCPNKRQKHLFGLQSFAFSLAGELHLPLESININIMKKVNLIVIMILIMSAGVSAQSGGAHPKNLNPGNAPEGNGSRVDPAIFLQGTYVELGIAQGGSFGVLTPPPVGYHTYNPQLGFIADHNLDGWLNGVPPQSGDYFLPGYPFEGWLVEYTYQAVEYTFKNSDAVGYYGVPQTSLTNTSAGNTLSAMWTGTATGGGQSLLVEQHTHFLMSDGKFSIDITLTNTGSEPLQDVEYARVVDPDQEVEIGGDFITSNYVSHQPSGSSTLAQVVAIGPSFNVPMALRMNHPNAKAHVILFDLEIYTPNEPLDNTNAPTEAAPYVNDVGVAVAVRFPVLNPGQSESFTVVYALNMEDVQNPVDVPLSNWSLAILIGLILIFTIIRFRRMN